MWMLLFACQNSPVPEKWSHKSVSQIPESFTSSFLVNGEQRYLIDAGYNPEATEIRSHLSDLQLELSDLTAVLLTHGHGDHIGGLKAMQDTPIYAFPDEDDVLNQRGVRDFEHLTDGQRFTIDETGKDLIVIGLPGHTPGTALFYVDGVLIIGDAGVSHKSGSIGPSPWYFNENHEAAKQALATIDEKIEALSLEIEWVVFSHSGPMPGDQALIALQEYAP